MKNLKKLRGVLKSATEDGDRRCLGFVLNDILSHACSGSGYDFPTDEATEGTLEISGIDILKGPDEYKTTSVTSLDINCQLQTKNIQLVTPNRIRSTPNIVVHMQSETGDQYALTVLFHKGHLHLNLFQAVNGDYFCIVNQSSERFGTTIGAAKGVNNE